MPKILVAMCDTFDERFGFLYEDMEVTNATSPSNKTMQKMCTTLNSWAWGIDYITSQPTVQKLGKEIDAVKFIYNHFSDLPALQNFECHESWGSVFPTCGIQTSVLWRKEVWHIKHAVNFISLCWWEVPYLPCDRTLLICLVP